MSDVAVGLGACLVSVLCFGSMFVAVRRFPTGDGFFVQWCVCSAIFCVGAITHLARGVPVFQPLAMLGGSLWAAGNLTAVPIINAIGLGLGVLIWGVVNCTIGWAIGRFGLFGTKPNVPLYPNLNYVGLLLVLAGGVLFAQVKNNRPQPSDEADEPEAGGCSIQAASGDRSPAHATDEEGAGLVESVDREDQPDPRTAISAQPGRVSKEKIIGILMSVFAGCCYGSTFTPVVYIQDNPSRFVSPPRDAIDYVLPHFTGIYLTSTLAFVLYAVFKRNRPFVERRVCLAAFLAGLLWATAMLAWFVANDRLSQAITFPINGMVPGVVATGFSVFHFKEITGRRNFQILGIAIPVTLAGAALVGLSKGGL